MSRVRLLLIAALLTRAVSAHALPEEGRRWYRLDATGVTAYTDGDPDRAEAVVRELLRFRSALEAALPGGPPPDGRPLVIHLFESEGAFRAHAPIVEGRVSGAAGFFLPRRDGTFAALKLSSLAGTRVVKHELVHHRVHRLAPAAPPWLDEGLAEYFASARLADGQLVLGDPIPDHLGRLRGAPALPVDRIVRAPAFLSAHSGNEQAKRLYAQSWALVHWLRTGGAEPRVLFERQLGELERRGERAADLVELSGLEPAVLWSRVAAHLSREVLPSERLEVPEPPGLALERRRLDRGETLAAIGELLLAVGRTEEAGEHFEAARRARSSWGRAWRGLALAREAAGDAEGARAFHEAAVERAPRDPEVLLSLGRNLLGTTGRDFDPDRVPLADARRARELLRRAVELAPDRAESLAALGLAGLMTTDDADPETGAALEIALEHLPHRGDVAYHLLLWHLRRGQLEKALRLLEESVLPREEPESVVAVRALNAVTLATVEKAQALAAEGRRAEARALLEARRDAGLHESMRPQVLALIRDLR